MPDEATCLIPDCPSLCARCAAALCLRKQVINLALGLADEMLCLDCLGADSQTSAESVLNRMIPYIMARECFSKQWNRYGDAGACPDPEGCHRKTCFMQQD